MIEILTIGTELLLGTTIDTNGAWLSTQLTEAGMRVSRRTTVADDAAAIRGALTAALGRTGIVICTGGLGPTSDDFTLPVVAQLYGERLELNRKWLAHIESSFARRGIRMPAVNRNQALLPPGATLLPNLRGTAPGLVLQRPGLGVTILLPGVPSEMRALATEHVLPWLARHFGRPLRPIVSRTLRTTGIAESAIEERLADLFQPTSPPAASAAALEPAASAAPAAPAASAVPAAPTIRGLPVAVASLPALTGTDIRLTCWGGLEAAAAVAALDEAERLVRERIGKWVYGHAGDDLAAVLGEVLRRRGLTLATAESCTGGLIAQRITDVAGSSDYFVGGVVAYSNDLKERLVGVRPATLAQHGAVSEAVARELAEGVVAATGADCAMAVTGIAGPGGGTPEKPVGTVWLAVTTPASGTWAALQRFTGDRSEVRIRAAQAALAMLLRQLEAEPHESR